MPHLDRRTLIAGALGAAAMPGVAFAARPASGKLNFVVVRNGKRMGVYNVTVTPNGDTLTVVTDTAMSMKIGPVTVFDYKHHCEEIWRGEQFMEMRSRTTRDGEVETVSANRTDIGIAISTVKGRVVAPASSHPLSHWNPASLSGLMFNPQTGKMLNLKATQAGRGQVLLASGARIDATQWALRGETVIDDWYDDSGVWVALRGQLPDKSMMEYRRL